MKFHSLCDAGAFEEDLVRKCTKDVLLGLRYLHQKGIMHRDIKGQNVLMGGANGFTKLADFGASKQVKNIVEGLSVGDSSAHQCFWFQDR